MLTKKSKIASIEVYGEFKYLNVRELITVEQDGVLISETNHRTCYDCLTDISTLDAEIAEVANTVWTEEIKKAYKDFDPIMS